MTERKRDSKGRFIAASQRPSAVVDAEPQFGLRAMSALISRLELANLAGVQFEGNRDLYAVFGYKKQIKPEDCLAKYSRQDIATRIVDAPPGATWSNPPEIKGNDAVATTFMELVKRTKLWNAMLRADKMARMYPFSLLLFGFDDTGNLERKVGNNVTDLMYVRAIGSRQVDEITFNQDPRDPRYGLPETYRVKFDDPTTKYASGSGSSTAKLKEITVHHTRTVHIVENPLEDLVFGTPIVEKVFNLLDDLLKVAGGTSETYWLTGNRGMQANVDKEMDIDPADAAALSDEIDEYQHQLRRFIRTRGVDLKVLDSTVPNPTYAFEMIMALISGTTGIPRRILLGSEAGQLASEQDRANWADRIDERRALFATPWILEPTIDLLQTVGLLPEGDVEWKWPSAFIQNPLEQGQTMAQMARAIGNISRQTGNQTPMQLVSRLEAREILGYEDDLDESELYEPPEYLDPRAGQDTAPGTEEEDEEDTDERRADETADE